MRYKILLYGLVAAVFASCSSAYRASQTPDDVYFSPAQPHRYVAARSEERYEEYLGSNEDQYLRMKIRDRQRWSSLDDYAYWNDTRYMPPFSYNYYVNNWYNPYMWNNPYASFGYYTPYPIYSGITIGLNVGNYYPYTGYGYGGGFYANNPYYTKQRQGSYYSNVNRPNLNGYTNRTYNNRNNTSNGRSGVAPTRRPSTSIFDDYNASRRESTNSTPSRSYTPSTSSSSSSSSSGGAGRVSRPTRP